MDSLGVLAFGTLQDWSLSGILSLVTGWLPVTTTQNTPGQARFFPLSFSLVLFPPVSPLRCPLLLFFPFLPSLLQPPPRSARGGSFTPHRRRGSPCYQLDFNVSFIIGRGRPAARATRRSDDLIPKATVSRDIEPVALPSRHVDPANSGVSGRAIVKERD